MAEYIDREETYNVLTEYYHHSTQFQHDALRESLSRVLSADVAPVVHGKWEVGDISYRYPSGVHYCSVCDYIDPFSTGSMHYCPNCGAVMDA